MSKHPEIGDKYPVREIGLDSITDPTNRMRGHRDEKVAELVESMGKIGLINPITVKPFSGGGYLLLAGHHRLHAAKKLKWASIRCVVLDNLDRDGEQLVEIDENLMRADLSADERRELLIRRKEIWERHRNEVSGQDDQKPKSGPKGGRPKGFSSEMAEKTGRSQRQINRLLADPKPKPHLSVVKPAGGIDAARRYYLEAFEKLDPSEWDGERDILDDAIRAIVGTALQAANGRGSEPKAEAV